MAHDGDTGVDDGLHGGRHFLPSFQLDTVHLRFFDEAPCIAYSFADAGLVRHEGHVADEEGGVGAARDGATVV